MIYLDHNASTPLLPEAAEALVRCTPRPGNPASLHQEGQAKRRQIEAAHKAVQGLTGGPDSKVVLTASGTEADNLAVIGMARRRRAQGCDRVVVSAIEHPAVLAAAHLLSGEGFRVTRVAVDSSGRIDLGALAQSLDAQVAVVAVMLANNETGVVQPVAEAAALAERCGIPLHTDAVQAAGKIPMDFAALGASTLAISAHKLGGPRGIGALVVSRQAALDPLWRGGGQEHGLRAGTQSAALAAALAVAAEHAVTRASAPEVVPRRDALSAALAKVPGAFVVAADAPRLPNTLSVGFTGVASYALVDILS
ncbi:MAG: aminotransferase class V-fold PLP-dependent enzyme, partial [Deltaproteobacteria bacterium]|nr:aminotransferase class V-fold PLP-dependent enzyme [Deltaproteobacteria bacterium]